MEGETLEIFSAIPVWHLKQKISQSLNWIKYQNDREAYYNWIHAMYSALHCKTV